MGTFFELEQRLQSAAVAAARQPDEAASQVPPLRRHDAACLGTCACVGLVLEHGVFVPLTEFTSPLFPSPFLEVQAAEALAGVKHELVCATSNSLQPHVLTFDISRGSGGRGAGGGEAPAGVCHK